MTTATTKAPIGLNWRCSTPFIISTIAIGMFTDLFLYGLLIPIFPFLLPERLGTPPSQIQTQTSILLASYAAAQVLLSLPVGWIADKLPSRQLPFLFGLVSLLFSTLLLYAGQTFFLLVLARLLQGVSAAVVWTVGMAMVLETVGSDKLGVTIGGIFGFISVGELMAPVLGGVVYDKAGFGAVFAMGFALLLVDLAMRICIIERKVAEQKYGVDFSTPVESSATSIAANDEEAPLLANDENNNGIVNKSPSKQQEESDFRVPPNPTKLYESYPILHPLTHPRLLTALLGTLTQSLLHTIFDATLPLHAEALFGFSSLQSGLLFIPLITPYLIMGPICGRLVDKYGVKPAAVGGLFSVVPPLILLRLPRQALEQGPDRTLQIAMISLLLFFASISLSFLGSPALVEASYVTEQYHKQNPGLFGKQGPYGKLYAVNSVVFSLGLTVGPLMAGSLRESIGYGNMNAVVAVICAAVGCVCFVYLGGKPKGWEKWVGR